MNETWISFCLAGGLIIAYLCVFLFNALPAKWLCDYGEEPGPELSGQRLSLWPHGAFMALILISSFLGLYLQYSGFPFFIACAAAVILLLIATADLKYQIIPDQFVVLLLLIALLFDGNDLFSGSHTFHSVWCSPLLGAAGGAGLMLFIGLVGKLVYKREALGFGDVKLLGAAGLFAGFPQVLLIFLMTIFLAFFYIVYLSLRGKITKNFYLPLGPYICLALLLFLAFHSQIGSFVGWYLSLLNL